VLPGLTVRGAKLEAFRRPVACTTPIAPHVLVASYPTIDAGPGGYGTTYSVWDTASCRPVDARDFTYEFTSDHPEVAAIGDVTPPTPARSTTSTLPGAPDAAGPSTTSFYGDGYPTTLTWMELRLLAPGAATIHVVALDASGNVIGAVDVQVTVRPTAGAQGASAVVPTTAIALDRAANP
jgi:hypothetical protein